MRTMAEGSASAGLLVLLLTVACTDASLPDTDDSHRQRPAVMAADEDVIAWRTDTVVTIGSADGDPAREFNTIVGGSVLADGSFLVVDAREGRVARFDSTGSYLGSVQSWGEGPGELQYPVAHWVDGDTLLFVLDGQLARLNQLRIGPAGLEYVQMWPVNQRFRSVCRLGQSLWLGGLLDDRLIHRLESDGTTSRSVGRPPEIAGMAELGLFGEALAYPQLVRPRVHCDPLHDLIVVGSMSNPRVQALSSDGDVVWSTDIPDIVPVTFELDRDGALLNGVNPETGSHLLRAIVPWDSDHLLLQYEVRRDEAASESGSTTPRFDSRLIRIDSGRQTGRSLQIPPLAGGNGELFLTLDTGLVPRVSLLRRVDTVGH